MHIGYLSIHCTLYSRTEHNPDCFSQHTWLLFLALLITSSYLELIKSECEVKNFCKLLSKSLLSLQVLRWGVRGAGQGAQQAPQPGLCNTGQEFATKTAPWISTAWYPACQTQNTQLPKYMVINNKGTP